MRSTGSATSIKSGPDDNGRGAPEDLNEAIRLYQVASELGSTNAMNNLGTLYLSDTLGEPNVELGVQWLSKRGRSREQVRAVQPRDACTAMANCSSGTLTRPSSISSSRPTSVFRRPMSRWAGCIRTATASRRISRKPRSTTSSGGPRPIPKQDAQLEDANARLDSLDLTRAAARRSGGPRRRLDQGERDLARPVPTTNCSRLAPAATICAGRHFASRIS